MPRVSEAKKDDWQGMGGSWGERDILVEVKDREGNPVRAFKTNPLGQFGASTPLTNGDYTIEFEDPKGMNKFDKIAFTASGDIILPIEILSIDTREELRKSLFNANIGQD